MYLSKSIRACLRSVVAGAALSVAGCAADASSFEPEIQGSQQALTTVLRSDDGTYMVLVSADGTGCPKGTWTAALSPDGENLTLGFAYYELSAPATAGSVSLNCAVSMKFQTKRNRTAVVEAITYRGYAFLGADVTATQQAKYSFGGNTNAGTSTTTITGPYDDTFAITDVLPPNERKSSTCGQSHALNANTTLTLTAAVPDAIGLIYTGEISSDATVGVRLKWTDC